MSDVLDGSDAFDKVLDCAMEAQGKLLFERDKRQAVEQERDQLRRDLESVRNSATTAWEQANRLRPLEKLLGDLMNAARSAIDSMAPASSGEDAALFTNLGRAVKSVQDHFNPPADKPLF